MKERICEATGQSFTIHPDEEEFLKTMSFRYGAVNVSLPLPIFSPSLRAQIRTCHRNERYLYKNRSAFSGKDIVSIYADTPAWGEPNIVYTEDEWHSDGWDPLFHGVSYDFSKPFFPQFAALIKKVPRIAVITVSNENSAFTTGTGYCKNCYLINSSEYCEDCYYGKLLQNCNDSMDCSYLFKSQLCYECFSCTNCYDCQWLSFSQNCRECFFSSNLNGCSNCCLCTNLSKKEYHFLNEPLSKEEYHKRLAEFRGSHHLTMEMKKLKEAKMKTMICKYANIVNAENCTGDYIENSRNCLDCYDVNDSEDCRYVQVGVQVKNVYDCSNMYINPQLCYETIGTIEVQHCAYSTYVFHSQNLLYCDYCFTCNDCFACTGLTRKQYCIFNKQYSKEEYENIVPRIIEHMKQTKEWGKFLPAQYSPFGYNESLASEYATLTQQDAEARGFRWRNRDPKDFLPQTYMLPEHIRDASQSLTQEIYGCEACKKNYRIIPQELSFYTKHNLPLPRICPDCRHDARMEKRNPRILYDRTCDKCGKEVLSTYDSDRPETIYCEPCYINAVF